MSVAEYWSVPTAELYSRVTEMKSSALHVVLMHNKVMMMMTDGMIEPQKLFSTSFLSL